MAAATEALDLTGRMIAGPVPIRDWLVIAPVVIPITMGALTMMFRHRIRTHAAIALASLAAMVVANAFLLIRVLNEGPVVMTMGRWLPPFGISFAADALGVTFALFASLVATICAAYAMRHIEPAERRYGFFPFLLLMMAGVSGAFLTGDIFNLYVWFEVFVISSFGLIVLGSSKARIDGAVKYATLNLIATTLFLIATGYLYGIFGTLNMADIARKAAAIAPGAPMMTLAVLYLLAFGMKAAAFPVNFWLPASYHTPRVVTAALFGGLLTKIGIYALLRSLIMLFPEQGGALSGLIAWVAALTMILGALGALAQSDTRRMMGFLVISGVGIMLAGLATGGVVGLAGTILYAVHSMLVMTALYLLSGQMREQGGSFSLHELSGLYRASPLLAAIALILALAMAGLPPGSGLWPKIMLVKSASDAQDWWLAGAILASGFLSTLALGRLFILAFWREPVATGAARPIAPEAMAVGRAALIALTLPVVLIGIFPETMIDIATRAAGGLIDSSAYVRTVFPGEGG